MEALFDDAASHEFSLTLDSNKAILADTRVVVSMMYLTLFFLFSKQTTQ